MTAADMDKELGFKNRMRKVGNNLRKFGMLEGETADLQSYHHELIKIGQQKIDEIGGREICRTLGEKYKRSSETSRSDMLIMKRYGLLSG